MRQTGFYWVITNSFLFQDEWQIAYWSGHAWHLFLCITDTLILDEDLAKIDENRITHED